MGHWKPLSAVQQECDRLRKSVWFTGLIAGILVVDAAVLGAELLLGETSAGMVAILDGVLAILILEMVIRLAAHLPLVWQYFRDFWDSFDFLILMGLLFLPDEFHYLALLRLPRFWRLSRVLRAMGLMKSSGMAIARRMGRWARGNFFRD